MTNSLLSILAHPLFEGGWIDNIAYILVYECVPANKYQTNLAWVHESWDVLGHILFGSQPITLLLGQYDLNVCVLLPLESRCSGGLNDKQ